MPRGAGRLLFGEGDLHWTHEPGRPHKIEARCHTCSQVYASIISLGSIPYLCGKIRIGKDSGGQDDQIRSGGQHGYRSLPEHLPIGGLHHIVRTEAQQRIQAIPTGTTQAASHFSPPMG